MDKKNKRILAELVADSRIPISQLAKKIGLSREATENRVNNLEKDVIVGYSSVTHIRTLGFYRTACYIVLQQASPQKEEELVQFLIDHDFVSAISTNIGVYTVICDVFFRSHEQLRSVLLEIESFLGELLQELFILHFPVEQQFFHNKLFGIGIQSDNTQPTKYVPDAKDLSILSELNDNARVSLVELAKRIDLRANSVSYRIKQLKKKGVISRSTIFIDFDALGLDMHNIQLKITPFSVHAKVAQFLSQHSNVFYYYRYFGNKDWDIDVGLVIKEKSQLKQFIQEIKENFGTFVRFKESYIIEKLYEERLPKGIFK